MHSKFGGLHSNCDYRCVGVCDPSSADQNVGKCCANQISFSRLIELWTSIVCSKPSGHEWHKRECLMGDCLLCGIKTLKVYLIEEIRSTKKVQRRKYAKVVVGEKENGDDRKITQLQYMDTSTFKLLQYLIPRLTYLVTHNFVAK